MILRIFSLLLDTRKTEEKEKEGVAAFTTRTIRLPLFPSCNKGAKVHQHWQVRRLKPSKAKGFQVNLCIDAGLHHLARREGSTYLYLRAERMFPSSLNKEPETVSVWSKRFFPRMFENSSSYFAHFSCSEGACIRFLSLSVWWEDQTHIAILQLAIRQRCFIAKVGKALVSCFSFGEMLVRR